MTPLYAPGSRPLLAVLMMVLLVGTPAARADLTLSSTVYTDMAAGENRIYVVAFMKGPWLRREMHAEGSLSEWFGETRELIHRGSGVRYRLYPETRTYTIDTVESRLCGPEAVMDVRLLGRLQPGARGSARPLDSVRTHLDCLLEGVEILITTSRADNTRITIWSCSDFEGLFGPNHRRDLLCADEARPEPAIAAFAEDLAARFKLSSVQQAPFVRMITGFPLVIESRSGPEGKPHTVTRISLEGVGDDDLNDSLFTVPGDYTVAP